MDFVITSKYLYLIIVFDGDMHSTAYQSFYSKNKAAKRFKKLAKKKSDNEVLHFIIVDLETNGISFIGSC